MKVDAGNFIIYISGPYPREDWWCGIDVDGHFKYGGDYNHSVASKLFWDSVVKYASENQEALLNLRRQMSISSQ